MNWPKYSINQFKPIKKPFKLKRAVECLSYLLTSVKGIDFITVADKTNLEKV